MKLIDNLSEKLVDDLRVTMQRDSRVSIAAACFSVYAYEELKAQLENIDELRFLFTSPTFLQEKTAKARREFYISKTFHLFKIEISTFPAATVKKPCTAANLRYGCAMISARKPSPANVPTGSAARSASNPTKPPRASPIL